MKEAIEINCDAMNIEPLNILAPISDCMNCLVTGGTSFIGSNLVDTLITQGHKVRVLDDLDNFENSKFDVIFHLASTLSHCPAENHNVNVNGIVKILEIARHTGSKVVYAGSSSFYGGIYENPYAFTKWVGEEYCRMYSKVYNVPVGIARLFSVFGPGHEFYPIVAGIFESQWREGLPLTVVGDGEQRRDFIHVYDVVSGLIAIAKNNDVRYDQIFQLGSGKNISIIELAKMFNPKKIEFIPSRKEVRNTLADITESREFLGWEPLYSIENYVLDLIS